MTPAPPDPDGRPWVGPQGARTERLELHLSYRCPNRCRFCSEAHQLAQFGQLSISLSQVKAVLRRHLARGVRSLHLTGGEPTVHPDFVEVVTLAKQLGMTTSVGTNGVMLCEQSFASQALPHLDEVMFSIHGPDAATHDAQTRRAGSFDQVTAALTLARRLAPGLDTFVNVVVTRHNVALLAETVALAAELGASLIVVSNPTPEGRALDDYADLVAPLAELAELLPTIPARAGGAIVRFFGLPMCILAAHETLSNDLHWDPRVTVEWAQAPGKAVLTDVYTWSPGRKRRHAGPCEGCLKRTVCMGVFDRYDELYSTEALRPERREDR
ncbi:MAG: radical SAM protein [Deltaproteobacteria bacterium]|nr:radical SAM protein [Deltaproteobacteria bacterium]